MGDTHAEFGKLNAFINKKHPAMILQTGDFGYFPRWGKNSGGGWDSYSSHESKESPSVKAKNTKIFWVDGNHEDHETLQSLTNNEVFPNVFYMKRGSTMTLPDGRVVLFMGGANSYDKESRTQGIDWFPQENISHADIHNLDGNMKVDIVISHTCPKEFPIEDHVRGWSGMARTGDCNRDALSHILNNYKPSLWYFGHWHKYVTGFNKGCKWTCLDHITNCGTFWEYLKEKIT